MPFKRSRSGESVGGQFSCRHLHCPNLNWVIHLAVKISQNALRFIKAVMTYYTRTTHYGLQIAPILANGVQERVAVPVDLEENGLTLL